MRASPTIIRWSAPFISHLINCYSIRSYYLIDNAAVGAWGVFVILCFCPTLRDQITNSPVTYLPPLTSHGVSTLLPRPQGQGRLLDIVQNMSMRLPVGEIANAFRDKPPLTIYRPFWPAIIAEIFPCPQSRNSLSSSVTPKKKAQQCLPASLTRESTCVPPSLGICCPDHTTPAPECLLLCAPTY